MGSTPTVEAVARLGVALPEDVVGFAIDTLDRLPFVEDLPETVAGRLPLRRLRTDLLGFGGQCLLAGDGVGACLLLALPDLVGDLVGTPDDCGQSRVQSRNIADHMGVGQLVEQMSGCSLRLARIARPRGKTLLQDLHLGGQIVEASGEVVESLFDGARLPRPDFALTVFGLQPHHAVLVDPAELVRIAVRDQRGGDHRRGLHYVRTGRRTGSGTRFGARTRLGLGSGGIRGRNEGGRIRCR